MTAVGVLEEPFTCCRTTAGIKSYRSILKIQKDQYVTRIYVETATAALYRNAAFVGKPICVLGTMRAHKFRVNRLQLRFTCFAFCAINYTNDVEVQTVGCDFDRYTSLISMAMAMIIVFAIVGVAKLATSNDNVERVETSHVIVEVVGTDKESGSARIMLLGNTMLTTHDPTKYYTIVQYDGVVFKIEGERTYNLFKDRVGDEVGATLKLSYYKNGDVKRIITDLVTN